MTEDREEEQREDEEAPAEGSGATDDSGGAERAGLGKSEAEEKISE